MNVAMWHSVAIRYLCEEWTKWLEISNYEASHHFTDV